VVSTAAGLLQVGALNVISVAFFVLFVGLGVDFGIQFSVRYRAERHDHADLLVALRSTAEKVGGPLALAAVATAIGFSSFMPTAYRGLSELGQIAGLGMIIAFIVSITLLPAVLAIVNPPGEPNPVGFAWLAPVDRFIERHRIPVVVTTLLVVTLASPLLLYLPFDFDPNHLRSPKVESIATYLELRSDPQTGANAIDVVAPNLASANAIAARLAALPQVARAQTLGSLVPGDQDAKLKLVHDMAVKINPALDPESLESPPTDQDNVKALSSSADGLSKIAGDTQGPGPDAARRLARVLSQLAMGAPSVRERVEAAVVMPLRLTLEAGIFALLAIAVLLFVALRRIGDVLLTLVPLLVAGVVTLELCVVFDLPLNFANIIALPLLLGVGVAFKICYIWAWRAGKTALLQSSLTRAVVFSAMTSATAFGSLWLSSHPGTSSMGKLMALALVCTMSAAVLFQPALMGPPRKKVSS
jgi:predicted RND superfamily exporter protein